MIIPKTSSTQGGQTVPALDNLPARLSVDMTASVLGFQVHDVPILVAEKLLTPLGTPAANAPKFFARVLVAQCANDPKWLHKATIAVSRYWKRKRARIAHDANDPEQAE
jgi:hypothetical protein